MPEQDPHKHTQPGLTAPANAVVLVTPSDSNDLPNYARGLIIGGSGTLKITCYDDSTITLPATVVPTAQILPYRVKRVWSGGTTATDIYALI